MPPPALLLALLLPIGILASVRCPTGHSFGSIAFSASTGKTGRASNHCTRSAADRRAVADCGRKDCQVQVWLDGNCGAVAAGKGGWAYAVGDDQGQAEHLAVAQCAAKAARCKVASSLCSRSEP
jgi:Domain of unknown function (DUF4189)